MICSRLCRVVDRSSTSCPVGRRTIVPGYFTHRLFSHRNVIGAKMENKGEEDDNIQFGAPEVKKIQFLKWKGFRHHKHRGKTQKNVEFKTGNFEIIYETASIVLLALPINWGLFSSVTCLSRPCWTPPLSPLNHF